MYRIEKEDGAVTVYAEGRIDTNGAPAFAAAMEEALKDATELIIDCSGLEYISSSGLRVIMLAVKTMNRQGKMKIIHVSEPVYEITELLRKRTDIDYAPYLEKIKAKKDELTGLLT